ncbi:MAG: LuxR C-terminal-related transcriptional regulator [Deferribacterales bacterium]
MTPGRPNRIMIVEDNESQSKLLEMMITASSGFEWFGTAAGYDDAVALLEKGEPDVLIVDIDLDSVKNGIDVINYCAVKYPDAQILVHTIHDGSDKVFDALKAGASGYALKGSSPSEFFSHLEKICGGEVSMSPKIARKVLSFFRSMPQPPEQSGLSSREIEILTMADEGYTYQQIADKLNISRHTVHTHLKQIYTKLHVNSKGEALLKAKKMTII